MIDVFRARDYNFDVRGKVEKTEIPRPLQRLTGLRDDPAAGWLTPAGARSVAFSGWLAWIGYGIALYALGVLVPRILFRTVLPFFVSPLQMFVGTAFVGALLFPLARRFIVRFKNGKMRALVGQAVAADALQADDWSALEDEPDGRAISLVGWARRKLVLPAPVAGEPAIGIALGCVQSYEGVLESAHDFDLCDESGRAILISVAGGRLLGQPNVRVFGDDDGRMLVSSLDLPPGVTPTGDASVVRDGDPLMVVGFKKTVVDPALPGMRQAPVRMTVASFGGRPLLIYPIAAERRPTPGAADSARPG
jgi:hypothetical protein